MSASSVPAMPAAAPEEQMEGIQEEKPLSPPGSPQHPLPTKFYIVPVDKENVFQHPRRPAEDGFGTERQIYQFLFFFGGRSVLGH